MGFTLVRGGKTAVVPATVGNLPGIGIRIAKEGESDDPSVFEFSPKRQV